VSSLDGARKVAVLADNSEMPYDLFLGVPKHRVPTVVLESGMAENGWIPVKPRTLETKYPGVYAVGDCANTGTPKAGVFAEGAANEAAQGIHCAAARTEIILVCAQSNRRLVIGSGRRRSREEINPAGLDCGPIRIVSVRSVSPAG
jgi:hypothetical protein